MNAAVGVTAGSLGVPASSAVAGWRKGGFWIRVLAAIIDCIALAVAGSVLYSIFGMEVGGGLATALSVVYFVALWSTTGQTIGHRALGLKVVAADGRPPSLATAVVRYVGGYIASLPLFLGYFWVAWDRHKQGWHDKLAKTYVIRT